jgi:multiple sugar transport system substrate-binding protein
VSRRLILLVLCAVLACGAAMVGCGGDDDEGGGGGSASSGESGTTEGAKVIDVKSMDAAKGNVTYCTGKDTSGDLKEGLKKFNTEFGADGLKAKILEFPTSADEQRNQFVQRQRAKSGECDVFEADVIWTAEFATQKWLYDLTPYIESRKAEFIPSTLTSVTYDKKMWGAPRVTDSGLLFYRTDKVDKVPQTWQDVYQQAASEGGIVYQGAPYEGLTVDFLELAYAAGGKVLSADGSKAEFDNPNNLKALKFMVDGIKDGSAPKSVTTFMEEEARRSFENGKPAFMRNWPYAYALGNEAPKFKGKFEVAPYPSFEGAGKAGILGGHNAVISVYSKNPGGALKLVDYMTSDERITRNAVKYSKAPPLAAVYEDPAVKKALPFAAELKQGVEQAKTRPVSQVYSQISQAIYKNVNEALTGAQTPEQALKNGQAEMEKALQTF